MGELVNWVISEELITWVEDVMVAIGNDEVTVNSAIVEIDINGLGPKGSCDYQAQFLIN